VRAVGDAIGQVLSLGVGVALSPVPIIAVVLMLGTPRARANGPAFVLGWVIGLAVVGTIVLLAASGAGASESGEPATWVDVLKLVLGCLLALVAIKQWRGRPHEGDEAALPKWMQTIDTFAPGKALAMGALLSGVNPKNLLLTLAAASAIAQTGIDTGRQAVALAVFVAIGTLGPGLPVAIYFVLGARAEHVLDDLKLWMAAHNAAIMAVLCLVIAAKLLGDGISGLV
jgi:threonine/homoserine/homoserine lactone efflux protein